MNKKRMLAVIVLLFVAIIGIGSVTATAAINRESVPVVLKQGSTGSEVKTVQQKLKNWGYYSGAVDGIYGAQTKKAVEFFQRKNGLTVDGIVGKNTWNKLKIIGGGR